MSDEVTQEAVLSRFIYVKEVGRLVWIRRPRSDFSDENTWAVWNARYSGTYAGWFATKGYRTINVFGKCRKASRLIWVYHYGYWPEIIDHIDGDVTSDAIENLRDVSQAINNKNRALGTTNKTGVSGVYLDGELVRAQINVDGRRIYLGSFGSIDEAAQARKEAEKKFGFHPNHGRPALVGSRAERGE